MMCVSALMLLHTPLAIHQSSTVKEKDFNAPVLKTLIANICLNTFDFAIDSARKSL